MEVLNNLQQMYSLAAGRFNQYDGKDFILPDVFKEQVKEINSNTITYNKYSAVIETRGNQNGVLNIYLPNQWFYIASYFTEFYNELLKYKKEALKVVSKERLKELNGTSLTNEEMVLVNQLNLDDTSKKYLIRFMTDYSWWSGAKTIDRGDFYVSPILNSARLVNASQSFVADLCAFLADKRELVDAIISGEEGFELAKKIGALTKEELQKIYYGAPGTGKSFEINKITKNKEVIRTTFHPDSDYSTFVGAYKPTSIEVPVRDVTGKVIIENGQKVTENRIVYEFVEQAFLQAYIKAWEAYAKAAEGKKAEEQYLVIEEINRGNCAQIFGDLFQLLDRNGYGFSDYPIQADKDMKKQLGKALSGKTIADAEHINSIYGKDIVSKVLSGDILLLPDNLYIWATMNTSDQSLFPIDSAFKRRWDWKYMPICEGKENGVSLGWRIKVNGKLYDWWQFVEKINAEINEQTKSEDKKLGYFFCKAQDGVVKAETFVSKVIFYLWNDVFKDQAFGSDIFRDGEEELTFNSFYDVDANGKAVIKEDKVELFLQNLGVEAVEDSDEGIIDDEAEEQTEDGIGNSKHKSLKSVSFPDGTEFSVSSMTHFEVYLETLKKIGLDIVYPLIANMKYKRKGCPLMSTEELPGIINSNFTYQKEGNYYIVKGAIDDTLINVLNELNSQLNLGVQVNYE